MPTSDLIRRPGRPREFDLDEVITQAQYIFWNKGYRGASLAELLNSTGLTRGSLYKAFSNKKQLFLLALVRYAKKSYQLIQDTINSAPSPKDGIQQTLMYFAEQSRGEAGRRGCLVVATATEMSGHDADIAAEVKTILGNLQAIYAQTIQDAQNINEIDPRKDPNILARYIVTQIEGFRVLGKVDDGAGSQQAMIALIMKALE